MTMSFTTYKTAIKTWVEAQSGLVAQWRDGSGAWHAKPRILLHLMSSDSLGVDYLHYAQDVSLAVGEDYVPTVSGNRTMVLSLYCETRNQVGNGTASYYLEKLRTSTKKPSVRATLYAAELVITSTEALQDLSSLVDDRTESRAQLDMHLASVVNDRDALEADSYTDHATTTAELTTPAGTDAGWADEEMP